MKLLIIVLNYVYIGLGIAFTVYYMSDFNSVLLIITGMFFISVISNLIYVYKSKPYDREKEKLKKQINDLNKKVEEKQEENTILNEKIEENDVSDDD